MGASEANSKWRYINLSIIIINRSIISTAISVECIVAFKLTNRKKLQSGLAIVKTTNNIGVLYTEKVLWYMKKYCGICKST